MNTLTQFGLACIGMVFVRAGCVHFARFTDMTQMLKQRGWPIPGILLAAGSAVQVLAGVGLLYAPTRAIAAGMLLLFTVFASVTLLDFWKLQGKERAMMKNAFFNNVAIIGGLLLLAG